MRKIFSSTYLRLASVMLRGEYKHESYSYPWLMFHWASAILDFEKLVTKRQYERIMGFLNEIKSEGDLEEFTRFIYSLEINKITCTYYIYSRHLRCAHLNFMYSVVEPQDQ